MAPPQPNSSPFPRRSRTTAIKAGLGRLSGLFQQNFHQFVWRVDHDVVRAFYLSHCPSAALREAVVRASKRLPTYVASLISGREHECLPSDAFAATGELYRREVRPDRMFGRLGIDPHLIIGVRNTHYGGGRTTHADPAGSLDRSDPFLERRSTKVGYERLAVVRECGIDVDQGRQTRQHSLGGSGDYPSPVRMSDENDVVEVFPVNDVGHVSNVGVQRDIDAQQMRSVGQPGQSRGEDAVAAILELVADPRPAPPPVPRSVDENE